MKPEKLFIDKVPTVVYRPEGFDATKKYPVVLFLHGMGEMATNEAKAALTKDALTIQLTNNVLNNGNHANLLANGDDHGFIVVAPMLVQPLNESQPWWTDKYLQPVYDWILNDANTDKEHIKVTGLSLGGGGAIAVCTGPFAPYVSAAVMICPTFREDCDFSVIAKNNTPVWFFHAEDDKRVGVWSTTIQVKKIKEHNPNPEPKVTILESGDHYIWGKVYADDDMYKWMLAQKKGTPEVADEIVAVHKVTFYKSGNIKTERL